MMGEGNRERQVQRGRTEAALETVEWMVGWKLERLERRVVLELVLLLVGGVPVGVCGSWGLLLME